MTDYKNILVPIDFSQSADTVIKRAVDVARRNNAPLTLLHVVEYMPPIDIAYEPAMSAGWAIDEEEMKKHAAESLKNFSERHQLKDARHKVLIGGPKYEICQYARDNHVDLIVMGAHGRHGIGLLLGSTANGVLHDMPCDVMAVKIEDEDE